MTVKPGPHLAVWQNSIYILGLVGNSSSQSLEISYYRKQAQPVKLLGSFDNHHWNYFDHAFRTKDEQPRGRLALAYLEDCWEASTGPISLTWLSDN